MAVVRYGPLVQSVRGALGSVVFARQGGTPIVRPRPLKLNQRSAAQLRVRRNYNAVVAAWRGLTDDDRLRWFRLAETYRQAGPDGLGRPLSAWLLFATTNLRSMHMEGTIAYEPNPGFGDVERSFVRVDVWPGGPVRLVHSVGNPNVGNCYQLLVQRTWRRVGTLPGRLFLSAWHGVTTRRSDAITNEFAEVGGAPGIGEFVKWQCISHMWAWVRSVSFWGLVQVPNVGPELLTNGDMEVPDNSAPPAWWLFAGAGALERVLVDSWGDLRSLKWTRAASAGGTALYTPSTVDLSPAATYVLRFAAKCVSGTAWSNVFVYNPTIGVIYVTFNAPPADSIWHEYEYSFTVPAGGQNSKLQFANNNATAVEVYLDDVSIRRDL